MRGSTSNIIANAGQLCANHSARFFAALVSFQVSVLAVSGQDPSEQADPIANDLGERQNLPEAASDDGPLVVELEEYRDPLQPVNRAIFAFNDFTARYAIVPLAKGYKAVVPRPARIGIGNAFQNIKMPIHAVNHLLQGRPGKSAKSVGRFVVNTTIGVGGLMDPAAKLLDLPSQETDFEDTFAHYGMGYGLYLELPLLGPSDLRNGLGRIGDYLTHPFSRFTDNPTRTALHGVDFFQDFSESADEYEKLRQEAKDPYLFFRNLYLQGKERDAAYEESD